MNLVVFIKYCFPTGYVGPCSDATDLENHPGTFDYSEHINNFLKKELVLKGLVMNPYSAHGVMSPP